jgi:hypothetical protein
LMIDIPLLTVILLNIFRPGARLSR